MGVTDEVKPDGHRVEVHTNARGGRLGQQVLSRASGRKVYRHYSLSPENALTGPEAYPQPPEYSEPIYGTSQPYANETVLYPEYSDNVSYSEYSEYPEYPEYPEYMD
jgi:hypothetical protein